MAQPVCVCHVVSRISEPGRYRRADGTVTPYGASRKWPAPRSRIDPKTLGESGRGTHIHSTEPAEEIKQVFSQSDRKP